MKQCKEQNASVKGEPTQRSIGCAISSQAVNDPKGVQEHYGKLTRHQIWPLVNSSGLIPSLTPDPSGDKTSTKRRQLPRCGVTPKMLTWSLGKGRESNGPATLRISVHARVYQLSFQGQFVLRRVREVKWTVKELSLQCCTSMADAGDTKIWAKKYSRCRFSSLRRGERGKQRKSEWTSWGSMRAI